MPHLPAYLWALTFTEVTGFLAVTCIVLYVGARRAGLGARCAALLAGGAATLFGGWLAASAVIADHGWYHSRLGHGVPWTPVAVLGFLGTLLALSQIPVVARALAAPGMTSRLEYPHMIRVGGVTFLIAMALGHLPAVFALPAGLGDIAAGLAAPLVARQLARGTGRRTALWFTAFGLADLISALTLGGLVGYQLIHTSPSGAALSQLPLALIPTVGVPLLFALHVTSLRAMLRARRAPQPATASLADVAV